MQSAIVCKLTLVLAAMLAFSGCSPEAGAPANPNQAAGGSGSTPADSAGADTAVGDAERLFADALATARDINALMRTLQQQAATADTPSAAVSANQTQITGLEERAQKLHDEVIASGRFDAGVPAEVAQKHFANLEREVNLAMNLTQKGVQAKSFQTSVLTNAALNLNSILTVLRPRAGSAGGGAVGSDTPAGGTIADGASGPPAGNSPADNAAAGNAAGPGGQVESKEAGIAAQNYDGPNTVSPTGLNVTADTELSKGMLVLVEYNQSWYAADVLAVNDDGTVLIHFRGWEATWDEAVPRSRLQLVPKP